MTESGRAIVADIGGTHARFARVDAAGQLSDIQCYPLDRFESCEAAISAYLAVSGGYAEAAALAVAAPVSSDCHSIRLTNGGWTIDSDALAARFGMRRIQLLNDFAALALALPWLGTADLHQLCGGTGARHSTKAVLGPGTGLGLATLVHTGRGWQAVAGEGGHVTLAAADAREAAIIAVAREAHSHVSAERLLSGSGLPLLYRCVCAADQLACDASLITPKAVVAAAVAGDLACRATIETFLRMLATVAANLALTVGASGGVYLAGGVLAGLGPLLDPSEFSRRFCAKGRFSAYLADVPVYVILASTPALIGAARALHDADSEAR